MVKQEKQTINQKELNNESGRSMVEMLGVLALMGVLAIGGVMGYRWAMDRYNANEIINEVKKRAFIASQQRIRNMDINLHEFHPNAGVDLIQNRHLVSVANEYNGNSGFFTISVDHIPEGICNALLDMDWSLPVETKVGEVIVTDDTQCPIETESLLTFAFENTLKDVPPPDPRCADVVCPNGTVCSSGRCLCPNGWEMCGEICCQSGEICTTSGTAENSQCYTSEGECTRNEDCKTSDGKIDSSKYCAFENPIDCNHLGVGTCRDKGEAQNQNNAIPLDLNGDGKTDKYVWKGPTMTWWSAKNWCISHDKKLNKINAKTLNCYNTNGEPTSEEYGWLCCDQDATDCLLENYNRAPAMVELHNKVGGYFYWTDKDNGSCQAYFLNISEGVAQAHFQKNITRANVLCD